MIETQTPMGILFNKLKALVITGNGAAILQFVNTELAQAGPDDEQTSIAGRIKMCVSYSLCT